MANNVAGQVLNAIKGRRFTSIGRLCAPGVDFQAWTPTGHWIASDGPTVAKIIEVWYSPGAGSNQILAANESTVGRNSSLLEIEVMWKAPPDDQPRILHQAYLITAKGEKIVQMRVFCAGLHTEFPEVDLEKQRRAKGLSAAKPLNSPKAVAAKAGSPA
jgi:hypothetical protein